MPKTQQRTAHKMNKSGVFGYELLLDLYGCKPGVCDDLTLCYNFLDEIVGFLGMEKQAPPSIFKSDGVRFPDKAGLSGWVPLIESSIVIHTLTPKDFITVDIYCCRSFDRKKAEEFCRRFFGPKNVETQFVERGLKYSHVESSAKELVHK
jgi:S-adenosylmethionine/arginine decarboxylase-like enzyme